MAWNTTHPGQTTGSSSDLVQRSSFSSAQDFEQYVRNKFGYKDTERCHCFPQDDESRPLQNKRKPQVADFRRRPKPKTGESEKGIASSAASSIGQTSVDSTSTNHAKPEVREEERSWPASAAASSIGQTSVGSTSTNHAKPEGKDKSKACSRHFTYFPPERFPPDGVYPTDYRKGCDSCEKKYTARYCAGCGGFVASDDFKSSNPTRTLEDPSKRFCDMCLERTP